MKNLFILLLSVLMLLTGCANEAPAAVSDFQSPLSDDVETRFIQVFYQELNDPNIQWSGLSFQGSILITANKPPYGRLVLFTVFS